MTDDFEALLSRLPITLGTLRVYGDWFGRPFDNIHTAVGGRLQRDELVLKFDQGEELTIVEPEALELHLDQEWTPSSDRPPRFLVRKAAIVRWSWHYYGRPQTQGSRYVQEHRVAGVQVLATTTADWYEPHFAPSLQLAAVEFW